MKILLIQGANMEYLGRREPEIYGTATAKELDAIVRRKARDLKLTMDIRYTNVEGEAITWIYDADRAGWDGLLMNPAGFHYRGYALRDCLKAVAMPCVEVHMTNIDRRGMRSVTAEASRGMISGFGIQSYMLGLEALHGILTGAANTATPDRAGGSRRKKAPGRRRR